MGRRKKEVPSKSNIWSVALYIRLSKEDGNDVSYSVINQKAQLKQYIDKFEEEFNIVDFYIDDGKTGTDTNREDFQRMISDIERGKVNCIVVKDLSRLSRNYIEAGQYLEYYFVKNKVRFISLELPTLDSYKAPESMNSIMVPIQSVFNDNFARETSIKIRKTFETKRNNGDFIGAFAPYGYIKDPDNKSRLLVDEEAKDNVISIFKMFNNGMSKMGIAKELNNLGVLCPTDYKKVKGLKYKNPHATFDRYYWNMKTIDSILRNEVYIGNMVQGRQKVISYKIHKQVTTPQEEWFIVKNTHEPIIDNDTFNKAQELLKRDVKPYNKKGDVYLFAGLLKCADCGRAMRRKKTNNYIYYVCRTYHDLNKDACSKHSINEKDLTSGVLYAIKTQLEIIREIESMIIEIENSEAIKSEIALMEKSFLDKQEERQKINRIRDELYNDWKVGTITKDDYLRLRETYDIQVEKIKQSLEDMKARILEIKTDINKDATLFSYYKKYQDINHLDRAILLELIECIYIKENGDIRVIFNFSNQLELMMSMLEKQGLKLTKKFVL